MWKRVSRILRAEVEHVRKSIADRIRRPRSGERYETPPGERPAAVRAEGAAAPSDEVRKAFAALELPLTATADEVRKAWRALMARYHPDHHATDPEREALATELARKLTEARDRVLAWITSKR
jgi:DnaJ-domain-containing protein 1